MTSILETLEQVHDTHMCKVCGDLVCGLMEIRGYEWCDETFEGKKYSIANIIRKSTGIFKIKQGLDELEKRIPENIRVHLLDILVVVVYLCRWSEIHELDALDEVIKLVQNYPFVNSFEFISIFNKMDGDNVYEDLADLRRELEKKRVFVDEWFDGNNVSMVAWLPREMVEDTMNLIE